MARSQLALPLAMIRVARPADGARIAEIFAPYASDTAVSFALAPPTAAEMEARVRDTLPDYPFLVLEEEGRVIAYAYASRHRQLGAYRWCAEVSIYAGSAERGRGAGTRLYTALLACLERQGLVNLYAGITLPNEPSVRLHEKFGFLPFATFPKIGFKLGAWRDVGWWTKAFEGNRQTPPGEPRPFSHLAADSALLARLLG